MARGFALTRLRRAALPLALAVAAAAGGCATAPPPMVEPAFAARTYTPSRIALMPPDVFMVLDQFGENDPAASAALSQVFTNETAQAIDKLLRSRGYDVDLSARWEGIVARDGTLLVGRDDLGWLANGILQFENSPDAGGQGAMVPPRFVAPELAARIGWATQSDALLYLNIKGVTVSSGKRTAQVMGVVFFVVIVAAIILAALAQSKGGGGGGGGVHAPSAPAGGWRGTPAFRGTPVGGGTRGIGATPLAARPTGTLTAPRGRGLPPPVPVGGGRVYGGGPNIGIGVGVVIPLDGPQYTHDGTVGYDDPVFAGDDLYVAMTLVSAYDGRILWHTRQHLDVDAENPKDVDAMVQSILGQLPARAVAPVPASTAAPASGGQNPGR